MSREEPFTWSPTEVLPPHPPIPSTALSTGGPASSSCPPKTGPDTSGIMSTDGTPLRICAPAPIPSLPPTIALDPTAAGCIVSMPPIPRPEAETSRISSAGIPMMAALPGALPSGSTTISTTKTTTSGHPLSGAKKAPAGFTSNGWIHAIALPATAA